LLGVPEKPRPRIAWLWVRRDRADLDKTEAERLPAGKRDAIFVHSRGESNPGWKINAENPLRRAT
jgi:hypothetical protein